MPAQVLRKGARQMTEQQSGEAHGTPEQSVASGMVDIYLTAQFMSDSLISEMLTEGVEHLTRTASVRQDKSKLAAEILAFASEVEKAIETTAHGTETLHRLQRLISLCKVGG